MINILFAANSYRWAQYKKPLRRALDDAGLRYRLCTETNAPETIDYLIYAPKDSITDFTPFSRAKAVLGLWAGVESIVGNKTLTMPLTRMVDHGLTEGMVEWVTGHVLRHHLGMDRHILGQDKEWRSDIPPLARNRNITVLGLGVLGGACAKALATLNFKVTGWSRRQKTVNGVTCLCGDAGLEQALSMAEILVLLLPHTASTQNLINDKRLAQMPRDSVIINPGRGALIDDSALLAALDCGHISHATLDVFRVEPLPEKHPFWAHKNVTVTPHIASETRPETASQVIAENIGRSQAGLSMHHLVDRSAGY